MTIKVRATRMLLAVTVAITGLGMVAPGRADSCALSEGANTVTWGCDYFLDVPAGVDMMRASGDETMRGTIYVAGRGCGFGGPGGPVCTVPGPGGNRLSVKVLLDYRVNHSYLRITFSEAAAVTAATVGSIWPGGHAAMYRFDGLEGAALISLASSEDLGLSVRRGTPPTFDQSDCVSDESSSRYIRYPGVGNLDGKGNVSAGKESCGLPAAAGPVYAFVTLRAVTFVESPCRWTFVLYGNSCLPPPSLIPSLGCSAYYGQGTCINYPRNFVIAGNKA